MNKLNNITREIIRETKVVSTRYPDLEVELKWKNTSHLFAVECKYRSSISDAFEWTTQEKIDIYNKTRKTATSPPSSSSA